MTTGTPENSEPIEIDEDLITEADNRYFANAEEYVKVITHLKMLGVAYITVEFSGGGDSGSVHDPVATNSTGSTIDLTQHKTTITVKKSVWRNNQWVEKADAQELSYDAIFARICEIWLESVGIDWYNDEGGQGQLEVDLTVSPPKFSLAVGVNHRTTQDHYFEAD